MRWLEAEDDEFMLCSEKGYDLYRNTSNPERQAGRRSRRAINCTKPNYRGQLSIGRCQHRPAHDFLRERHARVCGAGRGQGSARNHAMRLGKGGQDEPLVELSGRRAIEGDEPDIRVNMEERGKVVRDRVLADIGIKTSGTGSRREYIPECDAMLAQRREPSGVVRRQLRNLGGDNLPERVL